VAEIRPYRHCASLLTRLLYVCVLCGCANCLTVLQRYLAKDFMALVKEETFPDALLWSVEDVALRQDLLEYEENDPMVRRRLRRASIVQQYNW
jgi:hypothetical protein